MTEPTVDPRRAWITLAESVKNWDDQAIIGEEVIEAIRVLPITDQEAMELTDIFYSGGSKDAVAWGVAEKLDDKPDFDMEKFVAHALSTKLGPRRAWINLAEAIRLLPVEDEFRQTLAEATAAHLDGQRKFDAARFIFHATSDDEDGHWTYNQVHPDPNAKH